MNRWSRRRARRLLVAAVLALASLGWAGQSNAASFVGVQTSPTEWTYTLTYAPLDNYAVCPAPGNVATITLSGLSGVVSATQPTSTDFPEQFHNDINIQWMPQVSADGSVVTWTHLGPGTGNFPTEKHVYGFKVQTATPSDSGPVDVESAGFSFDVSVTGPCPVQPADDRDFTGTTQGPVGDRTPPVLTVPAPIVVDATGPSGALVNYTATATDAIDANPTVTCAPASGSVFSIGTTAVTCTATDSSGNSSTSTFTVEVKGAGPQLNDLALAVAGLGPGSSLLGKVTDAQAALANADVGTACQILDAFINEVIAQTNKKITPTTAAQLSLAAEQIQAVLAC